MDVLCGSSSWNPIIGDQLLSSCFRMTVLDTGLPLLFIILTAPFLLSKLITSSNLNSSPHDKSLPVHDLSEAIQILNRISAILNLIILGMIIISRTYEVYELVVFILQFLIWVYLVFMSAYAFPRILGQNQLYSRSTLDTMWFALAITNGYEAYLQTKQQKLELIIVLHIIIAFTSGVLVILGRLFTAKLNEARKMFYVALPAAADYVITPSLEISARWWQKPTFAWMNPLLNLGLVKTIEKEDMPDLSPEDKAEAIERRFKLLRSPQHSLFYSLFRLAWHNFRIQMFFGFLLAPFLTFASPLFLNLIVSYIQSGYSSMNKVNAYALVFGFFLFTFFRSAIEAQSFFYGRRVGLQIRTILLNEVYRKALRRKIGRVNSSGNSQSKDSESEKNASTGKIVTLMSVDAERIRDFICYIHQFSAAPIQIAICLTALCLLLGPSALGGVAAMALAIPFNVGIGILTNRCQTRLMSKTDFRVDIVNEILTGIRIIKYLAWEEKFSEKVMKARDAELRELVNIMTIHVLQHLLWSCLPLFVSLATFFFYAVISKHELDAATAFSTLALFNVLHFPLTIFPEAILQSFQVAVSFKRIVSFLNEAELETHASSSVGVAANASQEEFIGFNDASFAWNLLSANQETPETPMPGFGSFSLNGLNASFPLGKLSLVVGATGAGKTSLLSALLGEMDRVNGLICLPRESIYPNPVNYHGVAYVAGVPWLQCATVRENILFGLPYDEERYDSVIYACALARDFEQFDKGDQSEIGERGINLSGGQKARIALARAVYSYAKVILLDDVLSAVDGPTAHHLVSEAICGSLSGRTVILVSHAISLVLPRAQYVVVMDYGAIVASGSPSKVLQNSRASAILGSEASNAPNFSADIDEDTITPAPVPFEPLMNMGSSLPNLIPNRLIEEERKDSGAVRLSVYAFYLAAAGGVPFVLMWALFSCVHRADQVLSDWWIRWWSAAYRNGGSGLLSYFLMVMSSEPRVNVMYYVGIYGLLGIGLIILNVVTNIIMYCGSYRASRKLHANLLDAVLRSPLRFFETTPLGRIVNRFSKDISSVDSDVVFSVFVFALNVIDLVSLLAVISFVNRWFLLAVPPIMYVYYTIAVKYSTCTRELKRIESIARSPIYSLFSETLGGVSTIRAFGHEDRFTNESQRRVDIYHRAFFHIWAANRWLGYRIDCVVACVVFPTTLSILMMNPDAGLAGLVLMYSLSITDALLWITRNHAWMEMQMNAVERVNEYTQIPQESSGGNLPPLGWPFNGRVLCQNLSVRYTPDSSDVLSNVSFEIAPGERVAIVGRTGSGKTTLSLALFRIIEWQEGHILIDGIDLSTLNLRALRAVMTIIPQDPVLFSGTLRSNLDPFNDYPDDLLMESLKKVHFIESFSALASMLNSPSSTCGKVLQTGATTVNAEIEPTSKPIAGPEVVRTSQTSLGGSALSLDSEILEGGSNLSQGQRQLLCLARALLRKSKIVVLDEATSSTDAYTDRKIQIAIREEFQNATVFTIAHRLNTIIDYDKMLVLSSGKLVEFGSRAELLSKKDGVFRGMCEQSGNIPR